MTVPDMAGAVTIPVPTAPAPSVAASVAAPGANATGEEVFSRAQVDDLLNKARQQEKDKLYGRFETQGTEITDLRTQVEGFKAERDAIEKARADAEAAQKAAEDLAAKQKAEAEMTAKQYADSHHEELLAQLTEMREESARKDALFQREREFNELMAYKAQVVAASADDIAPELIDLVSGNTREEIDNSVALLKAKTDQLVESMRAGLAGSALPRPVGATGQPNIDPFGGDATKTYTVQQLKDMPMAEYAAMRGQLLGAATAQYQQQLGQR